LAASAQLMLQVEFPEQVTAQLADPEQPMAWQAEPPEQSTPQGASVQ